MSSRIFGGVEAQGHHSLRAIVWAQSSDLARSQPRPFSGWSVEKVREREREGERERDWGSYALQASKQAGERER